MQKAYQPPEYRDAFVDGLIEDRVTELDYVHLEGGEARKWLEAGPVVEGCDPVLGSLTDALVEAPPLTQRQFRRLALKCLDGMTADDLLELRDAVRSLLLDAVKREVSREIDRRVS